MFLHRIARIGVVDVYQGAELWDLNLVDPDNRRRVDFARRLRMLEAMEPLLNKVDKRTADAAGDVRQLLNDWPTGAIKLFLTVVGLRLRRAHPDVFMSSGYAPLEVVGNAEHLVGYVRSSRRGHVVVIAPRFVSRMMRDADWPLGEAAWRDVHLSLPPRWLDERSTMS